MRLKVAAAFCALIPVAGAFAQDVFEAPFQLRSGGEFIDVNTGHAAPYLFDFDGDGVRDLLVGEFGTGEMEFEGTTYTRGRLRIYRNVGSEGAPRYDGFKWFMAGGEIAQVPITCCVGFVPELADWDADGDMDMLTGSYPGQLYMYRNQGKGGYAAGEMVRNRDGGLVVPGHSSNVRVRDWDGDGDLDLIIATSGGIHLARNTGTRVRPEFAAATEEIAYQGKPITLTGRLGAEIVDWNGDGRSDLLIGLETAGVLVLYDSARSGEPRFETSEVLIRREPDDQFGGRLKLHVADYNGDGLGDLLIGDANWSRVTHLRPTLTEQERREYDAFVKRTESARQRMDRWIVDRDLQLDRSESKKIQVRIMDLMDELGDDYFGTRGKYEQRESGGTPGYVWVYLRKPASGGGKAAAAAARPASADAKAGAGEHSPWFEARDFQQALASARQHKRMVLMLFTGSDWCGPCIALEEQVFRTAEFAEWAAGNRQVVFARVMNLKQDFSSAEEKEAVAKLEAQFGIRGWPTVLLLDASGRQLARLNPNRSVPAGFAYDIEQAVSIAVRDPDQTQSNLDEAAKSARTAWQQAHQEAERAGRLTHWHRALEPALAQARERRVPLLIRPRLGHLPADRLLDMRVFLSPSFTEWSATHCVCVEIDGRNEDFIRAIELAGLNGPPPGCAFVDPFSGVRLSEPYLFPGYNRETPENLIRAGEHAMASMRSRQVTGLE